MVTIGEVKARNLCLGCGLCTSVNGSDEPPQLDVRSGFLLPTTRDDVDVSRYCPAVRIRADYRIRKADEEVWGPIESIHVGHAADEEIRFKGSSGGALSAFLLFLLERKYVSGVIQVCASHLDPLANAARVSVSRADIIECAGSRYAPAATLYNMMKILKEASGPFAFVGKPCDVAGIRNVQHILPEVREKLFIAVSFFCAGMPSLHGTTEILEDLSLSEKITYLRYRGHGWPGTFEARDSRGKVGVMSYAMSWGNRLGKRLHPRCKICPDGIGIQSDITFADGWEEEEGYPSFDERPGQSLILTRSPFAEKLLRDAVDSSYLKTDPYRGNLDTIQRYQFQRRRTAGVRQLAANMMSSGLLSFKGLHSLRNAFRSSPIETIITFVGTLRRFLLLRLSRGR